MMFGLILVIDLFYFVSTLFCIAGDLVAQWLSPVDCHLLIITQLCLSDDYVARINQSQWSGNDPTILVKVEMKRRGLSMTAWSEYLCMPLTFGGLSMTEYLKVRVWPFTWVINRLVKTWGINADCLCMRYSYLWCSYIQPWIISQFSCHWRRNTANGDWIFHVSRHFHNMIITMIITILSFSHYFGY